MSLPERHKDGDYGRDAETCKNNSASFLVTYFSVMEGTG